MDSLYHKGFMYAFFIDAYKMLKKKFKDANQNNEKQEDVS